MIMANRGQNETHLFKTDLVRQVAKRTRLSQSIVADVLNASVKLIGQTLKAGGQVQLTDFGTFYTGTRPESTLKDIQTGEQCTIPAMRLAKFRAGEALRQAVRK